MASPVDLEYFTYRHPRRSSDFCLAAEAPEAEPLTAIYGVSDMIGHPTGLRWASYMRVAQRQFRRRLAEDPPADLDGLTALVREEALRHDEHICEMRQRHDSKAFGFCATFAAVHGRRCRILWLGDCRAYWVRRRPDPKAGQSPFRFRLLTEDHNRLGRTLREKNDLVLFRNEMIDLGKQLDCYLGMGDRQRLKQTLDAQEVEVTLTPQDCLMLVTDGFYLPMARAMLDACNFHLTRARYDLSSWMEGQFPNKRRVREMHWRDVGQLLVRHALREARRRKKYRDDMAVLGLHLPEQ